MTARTAGFVSRAAMGMRKPDGVSHNITPEQGGCAVHHGGPGPNPAPRTLAKAIETWKGWQDFHMDKRGWNDIAYTLGVTQTGHVLAGRGIGVRTAAQGSDWGNDDYYGVVWLGGGGDTPTQEALDGFDWAILHLREKGNAGNRVRPHEDFTSTTCPDTKLKAYARSRDNKVITTGGIIVADTPENPLVPNYRGTPEAVAVVQSIMRSDVFPNLNRPTEPDNPYVTGYQWAQQVNAALRELKAKG